MVSEEDRLRREYNPSATTVPMVGSGAIGHLDRRSVLGAPVGEGA